MPVLQILDVAKMKFSEINSDNYEQIAAIYTEGIQTGFATFETEAATWEKWNTSHLPFGRIALIAEEKIVGWAALSPVSSRCVYGGVAEVSVYISEKARGKGYGKQLLTELIKISEVNGLWTLQSGIMRANEASIQMHVHCGFRIIGFREKIGKLHGVWLDNIILERRSKTIGI